MWYHEKKAALEVDGYGLSVNYVSYVDFEIALSTYCPQPCGAARMYEAWTTEKDGRVNSYRALAVCRNGHAQEF